MANTHETLSALFTAIANAIRTKTGGTGAIVADQFPEAISGISVGVDTSDATASTGEILSGETAYVNGAKVTGTMSGVYKKVATITLQNDMSTSSGAGMNESISYYFGTSLEMLDIIVCDNYPYIIGHVGRSGSSPYVYILNNDNKDRTLKTNDTFSVYRKS